jgi:peptide-methionine (R)-S-oxide reductase
MASITVGKGSKVARKVQKTEAEWKETLTSEQFRVARLKGTETAFTGEFWNHGDEGLYRCVCCDSPLFPSDTKFESSCGWPSFTAPADSGTVREEEDRSSFLVRTEVVATSAMPILGMFSRMVRLLPGFATASTPRPYVLSPRRPPLPKAREG